MKNKISKNDGKVLIESFFKNIQNKTPKEIKKIKKISMNSKIPLLSYKRLFCKKCLTPFLGNEKIRIKNNCKTVECKNCGKNKKIYLSKRLQTI